MEKVWKPEPQLLKSLISAVPDILSSQKENGQFGTEPWICVDQNVLLSLAAAWALEKSPYQHNPEVLSAIVRGGDALIEAQDEQGMWTFRKKDYSTWGQILMPWTYSRWILAYHLVRDAMSDDARAHWEQALLLGFEAISKTALHRIHNIPAHHAMGLYCAGIVFEREDWKAQAQTFLGKVVEAQSPYGWWSEHFGPVVRYNFKYSDALGIYYAMSEDEKVLDALERAARYHASYTYPDGSPVDTVDERNPYHSGMHLGNPGFSHTPAGRGYLMQQHALYLKAGNRFDADYAAHLLLYGGEGPIEKIAAARDRHTYRMGDQALIVRRRPWFLSLSAFVCEPPDNRWIQDRQNFVSVFHDRTGLIVGGGNTKLQPLWSTFTVGDPSLLKHIPGDEDPDFYPTGFLLHVPDHASVREDEDTPGLILRYGPETCSVTLIPRSDTELNLIYETTSMSGSSVEAHLTLIPHLDRPLRMASGEQIQLEEEPLEWSTKGDGNWIEHAGWRLSLPRGSRAIWPVLPHTPYRKGGEATIEEARLVIALPFSPKISRYEVTLDIL
jgi:hypothetical protein